MSFSCFQWQLQFLYTHYTRCVGVLFSILFCFVVDGSRRSKGRCCRHPEMRPTLWLSRNKTNHLPLLRDITVNFHHFLYIVVVVISELLLPISVCGFKSSPSRYYLE